MQSDQSLMRAQCIASGPIFFRQKIKALIRLCKWADNFESSLKAHANLYLMLDTASVKSLRLRDISLTFSLLIPEWAL